MAEGLIQAAMVKSVRPLTMPVGSVADPPERLRALPPTPEANDALPTRLPVLLLPEESASEVPEEALAWYQAVAPSAVIWREAERLPGALACTVVMPGEAGAMKRPAAVTEPWPLVNEKEASGLGVMISPNWSIVPAVSWSKPPGRTVTGSGMPKPVLVWLTMTVVLVWVAKPRASEMVQVKV